MARFAQIRASLVWVPSLFSRCDISRSRQTERWRKSSDCDNPVIARPARFSEYRDPSVYRPLAACRENRIIAQIRASPDKVAQRGLCVCGGGGGERGLCVCVWGGGGGRGRDSCTFYPRARNCIILPFHYRSWDT